VLQLKKNQKFCSRLLTCLKTILGTKLFCLAANSAETAIRAEPGQLQFCL
jgi:hypothetical protein